MALESVQKLDACSTSHRQIWPFSVEFLEYIHYIDTLDSLHSISNLLDIHNDKDIYIKAVDTTDT